MTKDELKELFTKLHDHLDNIDRIRENHKDSLKGTGVGIELLGCYCSMAYIYDEVFKDES